MTECINDGVKLDRRTILAGLSAGLAATGVGAALAQQAPTAVSEKGPLVWLDMDQKQLDDAYDQSKYAPNLVPPGGRTRRFISTFTAAPGTSARPLIMPFRPKC
jgi:hypothetical protein